MEPRTIDVRGAREHNLKSVSLRLPRGKLICFTGVSGSGKSSFAFDTLFAEGQRRYLESLSSYARQFLGQLAKPDVDHITGLSPAISIQQKTSGWNPRSTVGTITQIHDYLRVLFARVGRQHCTKCGKPIAAQSREQILARILELPASTQALILAPVVRGQKGEYRDLFTDMIRQGYARARVNGTVVSLAEAPSLERNLRHDIEIVIDRLTLSPTVRSRLAEAVDAALKLGEGTMIVQVPVVSMMDSPISNEEERDGRSGRAAIRRTSRKLLESALPTRAEGEMMPAKFRDILLSSHHACATCGLSFEPPSPQLFSFNSPTGMCLSCDGMGETFDFDVDLVVPDPKKSFLNLAIEPMALRGRLGRWRRHIYQGVADLIGFDLKAPWEKLSAKARDALLFGLGDTHVTFTWRTRGGVYRHGGTFAGVLADLREKHRKAGSSFVRTYYEKYMRRTRCPTCLGARLNAQALAVRMGKRNVHEASSPAVKASDVNIHDVSSMSVRDAIQFFTEVTGSLSPVEQRIATDVLKEIRGRLGFLSDVGLEYLSLDRSAPTLSGGESQRIRLASQIGAGLVGVLYILDEPSIGLHPRDNEKLLQSLQRLRDMGNTVIVVEHDEQTMRAADEIVDFGPGPGVRGGEVVAQGTIDKIAKAKKSITGRYLRGEEEIEIPKTRRPVDSSKANGRSNRASGNGSARKKQQRHSGSL